MWPNQEFPVDLVTFTEEILNEKLHFCEVYVVSHGTEIQLHNTLFLLRDQSPLKSLWKIPQPYIENDVHPTMGSCLKFYISENMTYFSYFSHLCSVSIA